MKLNLGKPFLNLKGEEFQDEKGEKVLMSEVLSNSLAVAKAVEDPLKMYEFAKGLYKDGFIEIDKSDLQKIKNFIEKEQFSIMLKAQLLEEINNTEIREIKKKK